MNTLWAWLLLLGFLISTPGYNPKQEKIDRSGATRIGQSFIDRFPMR